MTSQLFPDRTAERIHWISLVLTLPADGVATTFPTEAACEARLRDVRWPRGPACPICQNTDIHFLDVRELYVCRKCKTQFSLTSGTILHRRRLGLLTYFEIAEEIIQYSCSGPMVTSHGLKDRYGLAYATAFRLRNTLIADLSKVGGGLLGSCICLNAFDVPPDIVLGTNAHLWHLELEMQQRRWRALEIE